MTLKKTQLLDIVSVTGISTVGILTVGVTQTAGGVGIASTTYMKNIIMHNTGLGTARVSLYVNPNKVCIKKIFTTNVVYFTFSKSTW